MPGAAPRRIAMAEQAIDIMYGERVTTGVHAEVKSGELWLDAVAMERAAGWRLKPEGFCKGETCVPIPASRKERLVSDGRYNLSALAEMLGQPIVRDDPNRAWCFGEAAAERRRALTSLVAPDFALPDLAGRTHRLSDYRGRKVMLVSWASW
jgi:hypothetical protein